MILKILDRSREACWWMFDNLTDVRYNSRADALVLAARLTLDGKYESRIIDVTRVHVGDIVNADYEWFKDNFIPIIPAHRFIDEDQIEPGINYVSWVWAKYKGFEKTFVFNTIGFLLNDEGKTIEKISC